ncbi:hypothetical protein [Nostoc sp.]|uniref:hypothetical protein n=1 Tax=Nostoc sp. TaxID=1180 RepID=UPI003FA5D2C3
MNNNTRNVPYSEKSDKNSPKYGNFGHNRNYNFSSKIMSNLPTNAVGVMNKGFAGLKFIQDLAQENKYFVLRIKNN